MKKICKISIAGMFLLNSILGISINADEEVKEKTKISVELKNKMKDNEKVPTWVFLNEIDQKTVNNRMIKEKGMSPIQYEDKVKFDKEIKSSVIKEVEEKVGKVKAHTPISIDNFENTNIAQMYDITMKDGLNDVKRTLIDEAINDKCQTYLEEKRKIVAEENTKIKEQYINMFEDKDIIYSNKYTSTVIVNLSKEEIEKLSKDDDVVLLDYYQQEEISPALNIALDQVGVTCEGGTAADIDGKWLGHNGYGVKVGIIEAGLGKHMHDAYMLEYNNKLNYTYVNDSDGNLIEGIEKSHATMVTSIIAGSPSRYEGDYYQGVVPHATVYQTPTLMNSDMLRAMEKYADWGVNVVNFSGGNRYTKFDYESFDKEVDLILKNTDMVLVVCAGNSFSQSDESGELQYVDSRVWSPGKGLNVITVGNLDTIIQNGSNRVSRQPKYWSYDGDAKGLGKSSYQEEWFLPNKPDVSAPGTNIRIIIQNKYYNYYTDSGTSYSAPIVTGIIAQMMESDPFLKNNPTEVKALVALSSVSSKVAPSADKNEDGETDYYNGAIAYGVREKSGTGMLSAIEAVTNSYSAKSLSNITLNNSSHTYVSPLIHFEPGDQLRAVMAFNKMHEEIIGSAQQMDDLDFSLVDVNGNEIISYNSTRNNIEVLEYHFYTASYCSFKIEGKNIVDENNIPKVSVVYSVK